ncbi:penicillin-binding transpeptidase domain-containing protein, partial [Nonomuraea sp. NPDC050405]
QDDGDGPRARSRQEASGRAARARQDDDTPAGRGRTRAEAEGPAGRDRADAGEPGVHGRARQDGPQGTRRAPSQDRDPRDRATAQDRSRDRERERDRDPRGRVPQGRDPQDRGVHDRDPHDRGSQDRAAHGRSPQGRAAQGRMPQDGQERLRGRAPKDGPGGPRGGAPRRGGPSSPFGRGLGALLERAAAGRDGGGRDGGGRGGGRRPPSSRPAKPPLVLRLGSPRRRINVGLIGMTFILSIFAGRLIQMQGLDSKVYEARAADQRLQTQQIPAKRGTITDVNGHPLAVTAEAREIAIDPTVVPVPARPVVAQALAAHLGRTEQEMAAKLAQASTRYQLLARDVDPVVASRLLKAGVPGLTAKKTYRRLYPAGDLAGSLIGFVGDEGKGLGGIEATKNSLLAGRDGEQRAETGRDGQPIPMTSTQRTAPVDGRDVRLTIDRDIQWAAQRALTEQVKEAGASSGTVIVMDVRTAQIIAMANTPELDLNNWSKSPASLYVNRAAADVFEPGSTNKVITAAATLEAGVVSPDTVFQVKDNIKCADRVLRDAHPHPAEAMTFREAMAQSSNVATIMAARKIGSERLYRMLRAFGFGAAPGGGVPGAGAGLLPDYKTWSGSQSCTVAYGQGVSVTALQMASVYQTIANGGVKIDPQIVAGTTDASGRFVPSAPGRKTRVVSERTAKEIGTMLEAAVSAQGTGELAAIPGYRVAGKTGTADRYDQQLGRYDGYTASFAGFSPADAPRLVVLSVLQNPKNGHFGGQIAAPVFKDVMTFAIKSRKIPPTGSTAPAVRTRAGQ